MTTNNPPAVPGAIIRLLRNFKGMMQKHACDKLDISQQAYSKIESRKEVPEKKVAEILEAFDSNLQELEYIIKNYPPHKNKITVASFIS
jgi:transcriptional regulator with XRE-family HTH domain